MRGPLKLNLGCGYRKLDGWVNADKYPDSKPDLLLDLEALPWPFADNSATHVDLSHVLEHVGQDPSQFLRLMQELWRVCAPGAQVQIRVPHPRHDDFLGDPTHVRPIMPTTLQAFDQALNREALAAGLGSTPLGLQLGIDFQIVSLEYMPDPRWKQKLDAGQVTVQDLFEASLAQNNVFVELYFNCQAHKPARG
ncbi:MAG TPA: methyltransferase domain-containing protein [Burkholderiales bacterium]